MAADYDLLVIGGGINGTGIARDAVGRGASVLLVEMGDLAGATSSASTKLIHGGLRYLEYYEFDLVRKALKEREVLWRMAPHIAWPLRFILPHHKELRPAWLLRLGLFLYDHLGGRKLLPATKTVRLDQPPYAHGLKKLFTRGFEYSDCWVDDAPSGRAQRSRRRRPWRRDQNPDQMRQRAARGRGLDRRAPGSGDRRRHRRDREGDRQ